MHTAHFLGYAGLGAMNLDTGSGEDKGQGGPAQTAAMRIFMPPKPSSGTFFNMVKQVLAPVKNTVVKVTTASGQNTIVPIVRPGTNTIVPLTKPPTIFTPPKPISVSIKPPPQSPPIIPTQGVVCVVPSGPGWVMGSCASPGARQMSLADALRLTTGQSAPPPTNYNPPVPSPVVIPPNTGTVPVSPPATSTSTPAQDAAAVITASSSTAQAVAQLPPTETAIPGNTGIVPPQMQVPAQKSKKGWLIAGGVVAVGAAIAAAVYGQSH
jgi:hypothetical protein